MDIFLSVGRTATSEQEAFVRRVEDLLRSNGFEPRTLGRTSFSSGEPLKQIRTLMESCAGTVVIGFERVLVNDGIESRGSSDSSPMTGVRMTTVWNQVETALAYAYDRPVFVIVEKGLREEGLIHEGFPWFILRVELKETAFAGAALQGVFQDWKQRVITNQLERANRKQFDLDKMSIRDLLANLKIGQVYAVIGAAIAALAAAATAGYWVGQHLISK